MNDSYGQGVARVLGDAVGDSPTDLAVALIERERSDAKLVGMLAGLGLDGEMD